MKKIFLFFVVAVILIALFTIWNFYTTPDPAELPDLIKVSSPLPDSLISSPVFISGEARGFWYFEASFPAMLLDANGKELAIKPAQAKGEWMTENFVPFEASLEFSKPDTKNGFLVLQKDNPSGLPENDRELRIPIRFR